MPECFLQERVPVWGQSICIVSFLIHVAVALTKKCFITQCTLTCTDQGHHNNILLQRTVFKQAPGSRSSNITVLCKKVGLKPAPYLSSHIVY